jgi:hypothetical protein
MNQDGRQEKEPRLFEKGREELHAREYRPTDLHRHTE